MTRFLALVAMLAVPFMAASLPAAANPPTGATLMGTMYCPGTEYECDSVNSEMTQIEEDARRCVVDQLKLQTIKLDTLSLSGPAPCISSRESMTSGDNLLWVSCCVKPTNNACSLYCMTYAKVKGS